MTTVLILCGGQSPEHEISLRSARNIVETLDKDLFKLIIVGIDHEGNWHLLDNVPEGTNIEANNKVLIDPGTNSLIHGSNTISIDVVFPVLHGPNGEDGAVQGLLTMLDVPYVGADVLGSAAAMDKDIAKILMTAVGINVARGITLRPTSTKTFEELKSEMGSPLFVKPANMGSSVGVHKVSTAGEFQSALNDAFRFDTKVLVEEAIIGREIECAVIGIKDIRVTAPGEIKSSEEYSFEEKYSDSSETQLDIPAEGINEKLRIEIQETAAVAFKTLQCSIMARVDMFLSDEKKIYVNEINTIPGFTSISMYPKLWEYEGLSYTELITKLLELAIERHEARGGLRKTRL
ncbi:MAG: D-alanine--D-alanine ligase [Cytophagales bacterium]|nr:D-alanine--D-alanine ligase [Cytophagales bacterium]